MKETWRTPEFWAALITQCVSLAVLLGGLTADKGQALTTALTTISGGVLSLLGALGYMNAHANRMSTAADIVTAKLDATTQQAANAPATIPANIVSATGTDNHVAAAHAAADALLKNI